MPILAAIRTRLARMVNEPRRLYFVLFWGMHVGAGTRISFQAKLDKTNPKGLHIGANTIIAYHASIITHDFINDQHREVYIGDNCFVGAGAVVMPGVRIGDNCVVSPNSVVMQNVPSGCVVVGNPARIVQAQLTRGRWGMRAPAPTDRVDPAERAGGPRVEARVQNG